jgi:adenylosuccinate synthase
MTLAEIERAEPVYESHPGFSEDISACRRIEELPERARRYVERVEALIGVPVEIVSVGADRDATISCEDPFRS